MDKQKLGALVVCGGKSSRMGVDKALLPFGDETMLQRVVQRARLAASPLVVVSSLNQPLPPLPPGTLLVCDGHPDRGPLEGLRSGLTVLSGRADLMFVVGCDFPFLLPAFVEFMGRQLRRGRAAVPRVAGQLYPLSGVYRTDIGVVIDNLLRQGRTRMMDLAAVLCPVEVDAAAIRAVDPELRSLRNVNTAEDYRQALAEEGLGCPAEIAARLADRT